MQLCEPAIRMPSTAVCLLLNPGCDRPHANHGILLQIIPVAFSGRAAWGNRALARGKWWICWCCRLTCDRLLLLRRRQAANVASVDAEGRRGGSGRHARSRPAGDATPPPPAVPSGCIRTERQLTDTACLPVFEPAKHLNALACPLLATPPAAAGPLPATPSTACDEGLGRGACREPPSMWRPECCRGRCGG